MSLNLCKLNSNIPLYYYIPIKMVRIQNTDNTKCWQGCVEQQKLLFIAAENEMWYSHYRRQCDSFLQSLT